MIKECEDLSTENINIRKEINSLLQYSRTDNLEIAGVPETKNKNIYAVLETTVAGINVAFEKIVSVAHRFPSWKNKIKPIICKITPRTTRSNWLSGAKKKKLHSVDLNPNLSPSGNYVNEHLTLTNKILLGKARTLKGEVNSLSFESKGEYIYMENARIIC